LSALNPPKARGEDRATYRKPWLVRDAKPAPISRIEAGNLPAHVLAFFAKRGIGAEVVARNGIAWTRAYIPAEKREVECIAFPYRQGGEVVNYKYRTFDKQFAQVKGGAKVLYGLDDISGEDLVIVEGEMDKLACDEAGIANVLSVPDGAPKKVRDGVIDPKDDAKFSYLWNCREVLDRSKRVILATDANEPGKALAEELARRIGKEKCWLVSWPDSNDSPRKDANDVLLFDGPDVLRECIALAKPYPISGLYDFASFEGKVLALYHNGHERAFSTGFTSLDQLVMIRPGELHVVTGYPNHGKSELVDQLLVNLARQYGWRFALC
jgi:twinkle protein